MSSSLFYISVKGDEPKIIEMAAETMEEKVCLSYSVELAEGIFLRDIKCITKK